MTFTKSLVLIATVAISVLSCSKETSYEASKDLPGNDDDPATYGWSFTGNAGNSFSGCVDTAYLETVNGIKILTIEGVDTASNAFVIVVGSPTGDVTTGTYTSAQGAGMVLVDSENNTFSTATQDAFTITINQLSNTEVQASFSGTLTNTDPAAGNSINISNGSVSAVVGGPSPC